MSLLFFLLLYCTTTIVIKIGVYLRMAAMANYQPKDGSPVDLGLVVEEN